MADTQLERITRRRYRDTVQRLAEDLERLREDRGLSQRAVADAAGIDRSTLSRIEARARVPTLATITALATVLGAEPSLRLYPTGGPRVHDRTQSLIAEALLAARNGRWLPWLEVGVYRPVHGVIDVVLCDAEADVVAVEIQGELRRAEAQLRWAGVKADALPSATGWPWGIAGRPRVHRLLVLRSSLANRDVVRSLPELFRAAYPVRESDAYDALTGGAGTWPGNAMLWADVDGPRTRLLRHAPRGVPR